MAKRTVTVTNREGIHARAATLIADLVRRHHAEVILAKGADRAEGTEVLQILSLGAAQGEAVDIEATGPQAEEVLDALVRLVAGNFNDSEANTEHS